MWKYLLINGLWFLILSLVQFFGSRLDQSVIFGAIIFVAAVLALKGIMDPAAWIYYLLFSLLTFYGIRHFRYWAYAKRIALDEESDRAARRYEAARKALDEKTRQTKFLEERADEIVEFYEQIKEMSKSLNHLETFLVFSQALSDYFKFSSVKLAFFGEVRAEDAHPEEIYELKSNELQGVFDRSAYLADPKKCAGEIYPADKQIYREVMGLQKAPGLKGLRDFVAYPATIHNKVFAVLTVVGMENTDDPFFSILVERFLAELQRVRLYESVQQLAITDGLSGLFVRQHLMDRLGGELDRSKRFQLKLSFLMVDIDFFKHFNDAYGHLVGDVVLKQVAVAIKKSVREVDFVGRYGGEEFGVGLIETDEGTAFLVAERIRRTIQDKVFRVYDEDLSVQVSIGCATLSDKIRTAEDLVEAADAALYQAKKSGRNKVCVAAA